MIRRACLQYGNVAGRLLIRSPKLVIVKSFSGTRDNNPGGVVDRVVHEARSAQEKAHQVAREQPERAENAMNKGKTTLPDQAQKAGGVMMEGKDKAKNMMSNVQQKVGEEMESAKDTLEAVKDNAKETAGEVKDTAKGKLEHGKESVKEGGSTVLGKAGETVRAGVERFEKAGNWATGKIKEAVSPTHKDPKE
jgi:ElaB/YqjD/DUF883 family membrane-anchored ribosome-binding protein